MANKGDLIHDLERRLVGVDRLPDEPDFFSHETLSRYLKARDWKIVDAEKMIKASIEWRRLYRPLQTDCRWCHDKPGYHSMRQVGYDELGRPVIYSCFAQAAVSHPTVEDTVAHVTYLIENAKVTMPPGIHSWVFVIDCTGMKLPSCNPKFGYGVTQIMSNHYPERLGLVICLNHNRVFQGIWKAIKTFLHPNTVAKMQLLRSKEKIADTFDKYFSKELSDWLLTEIKLNKSRPMLKSQIEFWNGPVCSTDHDPRGCASYVASTMKDLQCGFKSHHQNGSPTRKHLPHPNFIDALMGNVMAVSMEENDDEVDMHNPDNSDEDNELEIPEEFNIPKDAKHLQG